MAIILVGAASSLSVALINWFYRAERPTTHGLFPGNPPECSTLAVIPTMLNHVQGVEDLIEALEIRFLTNREKNLHFGLLTDFLRSSRTHAGRWQHIFTAGRKGNWEIKPEISRRQGRNIFLFHRPRLWNPHDQIWMGYERKRGKSGDLLRGGAEDCFPNRAPRKYYQT